MEKISTKRMEMFIRVVENRQEFPLALAEGLRGTELFDKLGQTIEDIRTGAYEQSRTQSSLREISARIAATRDELSRQMEAVRQTVRIAGLPGFDDKFLPTRDVFDQGLITLARTYGNDAFPIKAELIKRGLGDDFINDLSAAAQAFNAALGERTLWVGKQTEATAEIERQIERGLPFVRELGVIVRNVYARDPVKLALWESVSHVEKSGRRSRQDEDDEEGPPPPAQD